MTTNGTTRGINWNITKNDAEAIDRITARAVELFRSFTVTNVMDLSMDITAVHANGCPLDLARFADASVADFTHDVGGIVRFVDRTTGQLNGGFLPRFAQRKANSVATLGVR